MNANNESENVESDQNNAAEISLDLVAVRNQHRTHVTFSNEDLAESVLRSTASITGSLYSNLIDGRKVSDGSLVARLIVTEEEFVSIEISEEFLLPSAGTEEQKMLGCSILGQFADLDEIVFPFKVGGEQVEFVPEIEEEPATDGGRDLAGNGEMHVPDDDAVILPDGGEEFSGDTLPSEERVERIMIELGMYGSTSRSGEVGVRIEDTPDLVRRILRRAHRNGYVALVSRRVAGGERLLRFQPAEESEFEPPEAAEQRLMADGGQPLPGHREIDGGVACSQCGDVWRTPLGASRCCEMELATDGGRRREEPPRWIDWSEYRKLAGQRRDA